MIKLSLYQRNLTIKNVLLMFVGSNYLIGKMETAEGATTVTYNETRGSFFVAL